MNYSNRRHCMYIQVSIAPHTYVYMDKFMALSTYLPTYLSIYLSS